MGLLKILFIIICVLWLLRVLARLLLPLIFQNIITKAQNQANQRYQQQNSEPDGRIRVDYMPPKAKSKVDDAGDFVDYEEIKNS
jgi:flagellar basal body-associated protein FliL